MKTSRKTILSIAIFSIALFIASTQVTLFVIQPIGAVPDGVTLLMWRGQGTNLIDSADALCERNSGGVTLLCRGMAIGAVAQSDTIIARLPYSDFLYQKSTSGRTYER